MKTLLTICIPTYKRPATLRRCIDSIVKQIEKFQLDGFVNIFVANDASPDETRNVLQLYDRLNCFRSVTREKNLGMNMNIKYMLSEAASKSSYQMIITDDDFLQAEILDQIVEFLTLINKKRGNIPVIWTPRYSYTEDGKLLCVVCNPFKHDHLVKPSSFNTGRYMYNGFVLSGLILKAECIDYKFWEFSFPENAYFPILFFGDLLLKFGGYFWDKNVVHHTVLNECHWERWGKNDTVISLRLFSDYLNTVNIMSQKINNTLQAFIFNIGAFRTICSAIFRLMSSEKLKSSKLEIYKVIDELKNKGFLKFHSPWKFILFLALILSAARSLLKLITSYVRVILRWSSNEKESCIHSGQKYWEILLNTQVIFKIILE